jgi:hypothetical protein
MQNFHGAGYRLENAAGVVRVAQIRNSGDTVIVFKEKNAMASL